MNFTLSNNPKDIDPPYKTDLDFSDCFGRKITPSYNQRDTVHLCKLKHQFSLNSLFINGKKMKTFNFSYSDHMH